MAQNMAELLRKLPQQGRVEWMSVRPGRREPLQVVDAVEVRPGIGLVGDRYRGSNGKREVTLIQHEHLLVIASLLGRAEISAALLRRNIAVSGINLLALKEREFQLGEAIMRFTGLCHPCSYMEEVLGEGGYNAVRGHGGINAQVLRAGVIRLGDPVRVAD